MDEAAWAQAHVRVIRKIAHEKKEGEELDLDLFPQSEEDLHATFRALWNDDGVYMFIDVVDDKVRYQNPPYPWENDGIEFLFAKAAGDPHIQLIIPAMVGTPHPDKPAAQELETGVQTGSDPDYGVHGANPGWDESVFHWAVRKTATGYAMEVLMDADIVTVNNSSTHFGEIGKIFTGEISVNEADTRENGNDPSLFIREGSLNMLGNSNQGWARSTDYGYFKLVDEVIDDTSTRDVLFTSQLIYDMPNRQIRLQNNEINTVDIFNTLGQRVLRSTNSNVISLNNLDRGIYIVRATDASGNNIGVRKILVQ